jgi:hypothetical protein
MVTHTKNTSAYFASTLVPTRSECDVRESLSETDDYLPCTNLGLSVRLTALCVPLQHGYNETSALETSVGRQKFLVRLAYCMP